MTEGKWWVAKRTYSYSSEWIAGFDAPIPEYSRYRRFETWRDAYDWAYGQAREHARSVRRARRIIDIMSVEGW